MTFVTMPVKAFLTVNYPQVITLKVTIFVAKGINRISWSVALVYLSALNVTFVNKYMIK